MTANDLDAKTTTVAAATPNKGDTMPHQKYTPGNTVTVGDLQVGDTIYARTNRKTKQPISPVVIRRIDPSPISDCRLMVVQSLYGRQAPWLMGWLNPTRPIVRAEEVM